MKRLTLITSVLCLALGASVSFAQDKMENGKHDAMERGAMSKPSTKKHPKADRMEKSDEMERTDKMDEMEKPSSAY